MAEEAAATINRFRTLMNATGQVIYTVKSRAGDIIWDDDAYACSVLGLDYHSPIPFSDQLHGFIDKETAEKRQILINSSFDKPINAQLQYQLTSDMGQAGWFEEIFVWVDGSEEGPGYLMGVIRSVEEQKKKEQHLTFLAAHDDFTGALNRRKTKDILGHTISVSKETGDFLSYILIGIDRIPSMNSNFGHTAVDSVIFEVAKRLRSILRKTDYLGRVSATKFGIVVTGTTAKETRKICRRLSDRIRERVFEIRDSAVSVSISIGVVHVDTLEMNEETVFANADLALREARYIGDGSYVCYTDKISKTGAGRKNSEISELVVSALNKRQVCLAYQPIVENPGDIPTKFECLARIKNDIGSFIPPDEFIPAAENMGLVHLIDRRILELAINTLRTIPHIELNVNVSWDTVKDPVWAQGYISVLQSCGEYSERLTVELTETLAIDETEVMAEFISSLKEAGCKFAIDDFGAGHTSFKSLKFFNIDILKVDGSFIQNISSNPQNKIFLRTFIDLARNFGMETVAEWVDNEDDARLVKEMGITYIQGYLLGKPDISPQWLIDPSRQQIAG